MIFIEIWWNTFFFADLTSNNAAAHSRKKLTLLNNYLSPTRPLPQVSRQQSSTWELN